MNELVRNQISGKAVPIPGDEVDTDRIIPARFLKAEKSVIMFKQLLFLGLKM